MPEKTRDKRIDGKDERENGFPEPIENAEEENQTENQKKESYYYDDSYGYEIYDPDEDSEEDE